MSGLKIYGAKPKRMYIGGLKAKKVYCMGERVWSAGNIVTYIVDGTEYKEEVESGNSVLSPTSFTPTKAGYTFSGWSLTSGGDILTELIMDSEPITLYACWTFNTIDVYSGTWSLYSSSKGNGGAVDVSNKQLHVAGYSIYGGDDYHSSGGYQGNTAITNASGHILTYNFNFTRNKSNQGTAYIYLYNATTGENTTLKSSTSEGTLSGSVLISNNDTYYVRAYLSDIGAYGAVATSDTQTHAYITCNSCYVS